MSPQTRRIARLFRPHKRRLGSVLGLIAVAALLGIQRQQPARKSWFAERAVP